MGYTWIPASYRTPVVAMLKTHYDRVATTLMRNATRGEGDDKRTKTNEYAPCFGIIIKKTENTNVFVYEDGDAMFLPKYDIDRREVNLTRVDTERVNHEDAVYHGGDIETVKAGHTYPTHPESFKGYNVENILLLSKVIHDRRWVFVSKFDEANGEHTDFHKLMNIANAYDIQDIGNTLNSMGIVSIGGAAVGEDPLSIWNDAFDVVRLDSVKVVLHLDRSGPVASAMTGFEEYPCPDMMLYGFTSKKFHIEHAWDVDAEFFKERLRRIKAAWAYTHVKGKSRERLKAEHSNPLFKNVQGVSQLYHSDRASYKTESEIHINEGSSEFDIRDSLRLTNEANKNGFAHTIHFNIDSAKFVEFDQMMYGLIEMTSLFIRSYVLNKKHGLDVDLNPLHFKPAWVKADDFIKS